MIDLERRSHPDLRALLARALQLMHDAASFKSYRHFVMIISEYAMESWRELGGESEWNELDGEEDEGHAGPEYGNGQEGIVIAAVEAIHRCVVQAYEKKSGKAGVPDSLLYCFIVSRQIFSCHRLCLPISRTPPLHSRRRTRSARCAAQTS